MQAHFPQFVGSQDAAPEQAALPAATLNLTGARWALLGFFVTGGLLAFTGTILLGWQHHITGDYDMVALYFLGLLAGLVASVWLSPRWLEARGVAWTLAFGCLLAACAFLYLAFFSPPWAAWWRVPGLAVVGWSVGLIHTAMFHSISPMYRHDSAATVNLAAVLFGLGGFTQALAVSGAFYRYTAPEILVWMAVFMALFAWAYRRVRFTAEPIPHQPPPSAIWSGLSNPGAVLLALLLLFQLGNEWALAGWLPLFLSQRLGLSPTTALWMLSVYWLALLMGRVGAQWLLPRVSHAKLLLGSVVGSTFACVVLSATANEFGALIGCLLAGATFAPIYPLVVEKIGARFPNYHPGFYNAIFSLALGGGFLAPFLLGGVAWMWGVRPVMMLPLAGSVIVCLLLILVSLEARFSSNARVWEIT